MPLRATLSILLAFALPTAAPAQRLVFAHYMLTNQDYQGDDRSPAAQERKIAAYQREIREAQAAGIDGFALNAGGWLHEPYYIRYAAQMFEAAVRLHSGFRLFFSADMCCGNTAPDVEDMMRRFAGNPRYAPVYFQYHGAFVLSTFAGDKLGPAFWQQVRDDLAQGTHPSTTPDPDALPEASAAPGAPRIPIVLVPAFFWGGELPHPADIRNALPAWSSTLDGAFYWGIAGTPTNPDLDQLPSSVAYAATLHAAHKLYMAPIAPAFWGANANRYYNYNGYEGMRAMWQQAAEVTHPDWVEIITWNDFIEGTYVSPIDDPNAYPNANFLTSSGIPLGRRHYFPSHAGITMLLPWFIRWYKSGIEPPITQNLVAIAYRPVLSTSAPTPPVAHIYGDLSPTLYITVNTTGPAQLVITVGGKAQTLPVGPGSHDLRVPLLSGPAPTVELRNGPASLCTAAGPAPVVDSAPFNNLYLATGACHVESTPGPHS